MTRFAIGLGSNMGDRRRHLIDAVAGISSLGEVVEVSPLYETDPVGGPEQDRYLNAVILLDSDVSPAGLLAGLQEIEDSHHRVRETRWGPRTLDLDIIASDGDVLSTPDLVIPHPRAAVRRFVLEPLAHVWPDAPVGGDTAASDALELVKAQTVDLIEILWFPGPDAC